MRKFFYIAAFFILVLTASKAHAEFMISSAILEFTANGPSQQDIDVISRSNDSDYIVSEISEIANPGLPDEARNAIDDPSKGGLLVTPDKMVLAAGARKLLRFVLLKNPDAQEHIYRVALKPVIRGVQNDSKLGLKILVGYEVLVIVRPAQMQPSYTVRRVGQELTVTNTGNTNILFQSGHQCVSEKDCKPAPVIRVYAGQTGHVDLPVNLPVTYAVWDGKSSAEKKFD